SRARGVHDPSLRHPPLEPPHRRLVPPRDPPPQDRRPVRETPARNGVQRRGARHRSDSMTNASPFARAWRRFARAPWAVGALAVLLVVAIAALLAPWIVRDVLHQSAFRLGILARTTVGGRATDVVSPLGLPIGPCPSFPFGADLLG